MNFINIALLLCAATAVKCSSHQDISPEAKIDNTAILGKYVTIEKGVTIKENVKVQNYATVHEDTMVGQNSDLGRYSTIGRNNFLENDVVIGEYATLGKRNSLASGSGVAKYAATKDNMKMGKKAQIQKYATVEDDMEMGDDAILNRYSTIMKNVKVHQKAYVGEYATVEKNAVIDELAVVHKYVVIPEGRTVQRNQVVIRAPSSYDLYKACASADDLSNDLVKLAANQGTSDTANPEFNNMMREQIDTQFNELKTNCGKNNNKPMPENLRRIISLYLIGYHGQNSFNDNYKAINGGFFSRITNNLGFGCSLTQQLQREFHFGSNPKKTIMTPEVEKKMVELLAIAEDEERDHRVVGDTVCTMITQIVGGERDVSCADQRSDGREC